MNNGIYKFNEVDITSNTIGGKAKNLAILTQNNFPVPDGFIVSLDAFNDNKLTKEAIATINKLIDKKYKYAVRSSAMVEDSENESWAGQFESYLNVTPDKIIEKINECHNSKKERAISYGKDKDHFDIAVIVQKMVDADYAGVAFSKNPINGKNEIVTEYIKGLGEDLVSGRKDPVQVIIKNNKEVNNVPFDIKLLSKYVKNIVKIYNNKPQDIEYAVSNNKIYILQSRPITTNVKKTDEVIELGLPEELFFWGPSRAEAKYMSDFCAGMELFFEYLNQNKGLPKPPVTLCLFSNHQFVWLNTSNEFMEFTNDMFNYYEKNIDIDEDIKKFNKLKNKGDLVNAFYQTEMAEFALYGAETEIFKTYWI